MYTASAVPCLCRAVCWKAAKYLLTGFRADQPAHRKRHLPPSVTTVPSWRQSGYDAVRGVTQSLCPRIGAQRRRIVSAELSAAILYDRPYQVLSVTQVQQGDTLDYSRVGVPAWYTSASICAQGQAKYWRAYPYRRRYRKKSPKTTLATARTRQA